MERPKKSTVKPHEPTDQGDVRLCTLDVFLLSGPITKKFAKKNPWSRAPFRSVATRRLRICTQARLA